MVTKGERNMSAKKVKKNTASSIPAGIGIGLLVSMIITLAGSALTAYLIHGESISEEGMGYGIILTLLLSAILGAWVSAGRIQRLRMQMCMLSGLCYYLTLLAMTALFFGGQYSGMGVTALMVLGGCGTVAILGASGGKRRKIGKKIKAHR